MKGVEVWRRKVTELQEEVRVCEVKERGVGASGVKSLVHVVSVPVGSVVSVLTHYTLPQW